MKNIEMNNMEKATERTSETLRQRGTSKEEVKTNEDADAENKQLMSKHVTRL